MNKVVTLLLTLVLCWPVSAEVVEVEYKRFYSHVRKLNSEDITGLQFAFGFTHVQSKQLCVINAASIVTPKKTIALDVTPENRFTVPTERVLKLADAKVVIDLVERANLCDLSVQLETKPAYLKDNYTKAELAEIYDQYSAFFNEMGSFLSFMMPSVKGLMVHFPEQTGSQVLASGHKIQQGMLILDDDDLAKLTELALPQKPLRITALAKR